MIGSRSETRVEGLAIGIPLESDIETRSRTILIVIAVRTDSSHSAPIER